MTIAEQITRAKADYDEVYEAGKKSEYDRFWDKYQQNGKRRIYMYSFAERGWDDETFKPKYDILTTGELYSCQQMFTGSSIKDLRGILERQGVILDTSGSAYFGQFMQSSKIEYVPTIDLSIATGNLGAMFSSPTIISIQKLISSEVTNWYANSFNNATALESVIFEGVIAKNNLDLHWSTKLNKESITSIINCLSTTTSGLTVTLSKTAVDTAFETSTVTNDGSTSNEWTTLIATKSNWTISLV